MNNGQKSLSINETFIIEAENDGTMSACTGFFTNALVSCTGNTQILLGTNIIQANSAFSATTFYGDGSNLTGISTQDTFVTGGTYSAGTAVFTNNTGGTFSVTGFSTNTGNFVPYTGATADVNLGVRDLYVKRIFASEGISVDDSSGAIAELYSGYLAIYPSDGGYISNFGATLLSMANNFGNVLQLEPSLIQIEDGNIQTQFYNYGVVKNNLLTSVDNTFNYPNKPLGYTGTFSMLDDILYVTGGTYSAGTAVFTNNTGGTFSVTGFTTPFTGGTVDGLTATTISATTYLNLPKIQNVINVGIAGNVDFTSIKDAVNSITDSSENNTYTIVVNAGVYFEDEIDLTNKPYVSIAGLAIQSVIVEPKAPTQHLFRIGQYNELSFMTLNNVGAGYSAIYCDDIGDFAQAHKLSFNNCDTNITVISSTQDTKFYGEYLDFNGSYSYGTKVIANNGFLAYANIENYYNLPTGTSTTIGNLVQGSGATLSVFVGDGIGNGVSGSTNYQIFDYASLNTISTTADNWDYGVRVLNIGGPSRFDIDSYSVVGSLTYDLSIEHPDTFGTFGGGSASHAKINNLSQSVSWAFLDVEDGEFDITRKISVTFQDGTHTDASTLIFEGSTMGLTSGGTISYVSGLTVQVSAGFGYLEKTVGEEIYMRIDWNNTEITLSPNTENYLYFNENSILTASSGIPDFTTNIILGRVVTSSTSLRFIDVTPYNASHTSNLLSTFNRNALGPIYANGSFVTENVTPYHLNVSSGDYYFSENNFKPSGGTDISFIQYHRDGSTGWITSATTQVINGYDNNSGSIVSLPLSAFTKHTLYVVGQGVNERYLLVVGQTYYTTLVEAEGADLPTPPTYFSDGVTTIASIIVQQGMSGITEILDIRPVIGFKAAGISATAIHGNLLGLSADDHQQYLLVDGSRAMTGNLSMGGNAISNTLNVNGVVVESHASRHKNGGADEIASATPAPSEIPKADTFGKLDGWISDASTTVKGLTTLSQAPASASTPIAVGVNDPRFLSSISGVTNPAQSLVFTNNSGGTTSISNVRFSSVTATTISATTYQNLPLDIRVTGGTYESSTGIATFRNNTGGTFNVSGYFKPSDDIYVTGGVVYHGPSNGGNNSLTLYRSDLTNVNINNLVNISDTKKSEIDSLIVDKKIIRGKTYKISGCDILLYLNGQDSNTEPVYTTVYLMGLEVNKLSETGIGVFYTPKYSDFNLFRNGTTYIKENKVIWGGYVWVCTNDGVYNSVDMFTLDPTGFEIIYPFNKTDELDTENYNIQYDDIIYDYENDKIIYRNEQDTNIVQTSNSNIQYWVNLFGYNPIKVFQWGNVYNISNDRGIGNQKIINSYNENINFNGRYQINFYFDNFSYQRNLLVTPNTYQSNFILTNESYIDGINLFDEAYQDRFKLNNGSYIISITIPANSFQSNISLDNVSFISSIDFIDAGSYQSQIDLKNDSRITNSVFNLGSYQYNITLENSSYINTTTFQSNAYQQNIRLENGSYFDTITLGNDCFQNYLNFDNYSYQQNVTLANSTSIITRQEFFNFTNESNQSNVTVEDAVQRYFNFNSGSQFNFSTIKSQSNINIENGSQTNVSEGQSNITIKGYDLDWGSYPSISPQINLFFINDLPTETTSRLIGKKENRLVEVSDFYYDGSKWVVEGGFSANTISATTYNGYTPLPTQAASSTGVVLSFITDTVYGTLATPETGTTISADTVNGQLGVTNIVIHSGGTAPTFSSEYKKLSGSGNYATGQINYIFATYITSTEIIYAINQRT